MRGRPATLSRVPRTTVAQSSQVLKPVIWRPPGSGERGAGRGAVSAEAPPSGTNEGWCASGALLFLHNSPALLGSQTGSGNRTICERPIEAFTARVRGGLRIKSLNARIFSTRMSCADAAALEVAERTCCKPSSDAPCCDDSQQLDFEPTVNRPDLQQRT